ncbi:glycosyltransferase family 4 protein [Virgibacillus saliphilus]|uniref:glycosyltransferase family 4 protein n=1 Tax=Virgibacillus saliphilus TaxID=2831674 RepID=UPI00210594EC|nr:glycosyltransferase family 4 protein [Virgibacillus sp. NKC19-3]
MSSNKVLILVNHDVVIYNFRLELVERLLSEGYEVYISSPYGERIDDLVKMGCHYIEADVNRHGLNLLQEWKLLRYYKRIMEDNRPDIVLTYTIKPNIYGGMAAKSLKIPYIANITGLGTAMENGGLIQKVSVALYKIAFKNISKVFFQNKENQQFFIDRNIAIRKHEIVPGSGVNLNHFSLLEYPKNSTVEFIFISRVMKEKGIDQYLKAAEHIRKKYPYTRFHILGFCEENYNETLKRLHNNNIIQYHGMQRDVRKFLGKSHCTIHPTFYPEGMSNVLLESTASGRPIITTDRSGCREIVDDGVNGYIVEQENSSDLIEKIEIFLSHSHKKMAKMGLEGRRKMEREFDRQIVVNAYMEEIRKITK